MHSTFAPPYSKNFRRIRPIVSVESNRFFAATEPQQTMYSGETAEICASRNSRQFPASSGDGLRFPGGRHLRILQSYQILQLIKD